MNNAQRKARKAAIRVEAQRVQQQQQRIINVRRDKEQQAAKAIPHNESVRGNMVVTEANKAAHIRMADGSIRHYAKDTVKIESPYRNHVIASKAKRINQGW